MNSQQQDSSERRRQMIAAIPSNVTNLVDRQVYAGANFIRAEIKNIAQSLNVIRLDAGDNLTDAEANRNLELAYRHLEDASMRLGKVLQAIDGGVSVYDQRTTVGAPNVPNDNRMPVNRTAEGAAVHADGHSELPSVASALESQRENNGAGESGGMMYLGEGGL